MSVQGFPEGVSDRISEYHRCYRNPSLQEPVISGLYSLFPDRFPGSTPDLCWPNEWPFSGRPCVYFIFDQAVELLYIGKAAVLGARLGHYFQHDSERRRCRIVHSNWSSEPTYVAAAALTEIFEPPSMEEYLIGKLDPPDNRTWKRVPQIDTDLA